MLHLHNGYLVLLFWPLLLLLVNINTPYLLKNTQLYLTITYFLKLYSSHEMLWLGGNKRSLEGLLLKAPFCFVDQQGFGQLILFSCLDYYFRINLGSGKWGCRRIHLWGVRASQEREKMGKWCTCLFACMSMLGPTDTILPLRLTT